MKICLILSGGGSNGIIQVGYCKYFHEKGIEFEVITGTSTGALQGAMYAQERYHGLEKIWMGIKNHKDIYGHHFPLSFAQGIFKKSLYSAKPLRDLIEEYVNVDNIINAKQRFISCSTNMSIMEKFYVDSTQENAAIIKKFIYASAAFPMAFEPVKHNNQFFWDGGLMEPIPVKEAVRKCPDADYYIIGLTNPEYNRPNADIGKTIFGFALRAVEAQFQEVWLTDIERGVKYWSDKKFILLYPSEPPFPSSLEWFPELYQQKIDEGYEIAKSVVGGIL